MPSFVRRKVDIEFTLEEKTILAQAQEILMAIEEQEPDVIKRANKMYNNYREGLCYHTEPLITAIDFLGAMISEAEEED